MREIHVQLVSEDAARHGQRGRTKSLANDSAIRVSSSRAIHAARSRRTARRPSGAVRRDKPHSAGAAIAQLSTAIGRTFGVTGDLVVWNLDALSADAQAGGNEYLRFDPQHAARTPAALTLLDESSADQATPHPQGGW